MFDNFLGNFDDFYFFWAILTNFGNFFLYFWQFLGDFRIIFWKFWHFFNIFRTILGFGNECKKGSYRYNATVAGREMFPYWYFWVLSAWGLSINQSIFIPRSNPSGFSNQRRLTEPLYIYKYNCHCTKTTGWAQVLFKKVKTQVRQNTDNWGNKWSQPVPEGTQDTHQATQAAPEGTLTKRKTNAAHQKDATRQ